MCGSSPKAPTPPAVTPEAPRAPDTQDGLSPDARDKKRKSAAAGQSDRSTILTGSRGVETNGSTATKTLLGQ